MGTTDSTILRRTLVDAAESPVSLPDGAAIDSSHLAERNDGLEWFPV